MKKIARQHEWGGFYGPVTCMRCGAPDTDTKSCLTDNEMQDRKDWKEAAQRVADLMARRSK